MRYPTRMRRRRSPRETRHREIKTAPEEVHRTAFAAEARAEFFKYAVALHENAPEPVCVFAIIGTVFFIPIECDWIRNLVGHGVDAHRQPDLRQHTHDRLIKVCDRARF